MSDTERVLLVESGSDMYGGEPLRRGLLRFRGDRCCEAAPAWGHWLGKSEAEIVAICQRHGYKYAWRD